MGLKSILTNTLKGSLGKVLRGAGLGLFTYAVLVGAITTALTGLVATVGGLPSEALQFFLLCGMGDAISILGAAVLTAAHLKSQGVSIGKLSP